MTRKIKMDLVLVGQSFDIKRAESFDSQSILNTILKEVYFHFGNKPIYVVEQNYILSKSSYPKYYSAGLFISEPINNGIASELVIISHGETMKLAKDDMLRSAGYVDWDNLAGDVK